MAEPGGAGKAKAGGPIVKAKASIAKAKAPITKAGTPVVKAKAPLVKAKAPLVKAKAPVAKAPVAKAKAPVAKAPATPPAEAEASEEDAAPAAPAQAAPAEDKAPAAPAAPQRTDTWKDFADTDPLYALLGEVAQDKVVVDNVLRPETLDRYLEKLFVQKAAKKPKNWVEVWASMDIPVDNQSIVLQPILAYGLKHAPRGLGLVLLELLKGHRVKTKAIEESVLGAMGSTRDIHGVLRDFLFGIFPRSPASAWGWSRIGWSFKEWWKLLENTLGVLEGSSAFDSLAAVLNRIEAEGGTPLVKQPLMWREDRLKTARATLCKYGGVDSEDDLLACLDATLK